MADTVTLIEEMIEEDMEALRELFQSDFAPLLRHRQQLEREAFDKAFAEVEKLEQGAR